MRHIAYAYSTHLFHNSSSFTYEFESIHVNRDITNFFVRILDGKRFGFKKIIFHHWNK